MTRDPREALKAWRHSTGFTYREVGALFGVTKDAARQWVSGNVRVPARVQARLRSEGWLARRGAHWTAEHDAWLDTHRNSYPLPELSVQITAAFGIPRTVSGVRQHLYRRGEDSQQSGDLLTREQVAILCGVSAPTVRVWVQRGWLCPPAWSQRGRCGQWAVPASALPPFIAAHAVQLNPRRMPSSPYRDQAAACWQRDHWLDVRTSMQYAGVSRSSICTWCASGRLPAVRQARRFNSSWMIRSRDLALFLRAREQRRSA